MTVAEQRFLESVPRRLEGIERQLEAFNRNLDKFIELFCIIHGVSIVNHKDE